MLEFSIEQTREWLGLDSIPNATFSNLILSQFQYGLCERAFHVGAVVDVIKKIQNGTLTSKKGVRHFKHEPLKGFSYAHWFEARFMLTNLMNHWKIRSKTSDKLLNQIGDSFKSSGLSIGDLIDQKAISQLGYDVIVGGYEDRARNGELTGEWIIFYIDERKTIFLGLAQHRSDRNGDRELYLKMACACVDEFPELFPKDKTELLVKEQMEGLQAITS